MVDAIYASFQITTHMPARSQASLMPEKANVVSHRQKATLSYQATALDIHRFNAESEDRSLLEGRISRDSASAPTGREIGADAYGHCMRSPGPGVRSEILF
jgi:hypothetical protein